MGCRKSLTEHECVCIFLQSRALQLEGESSQFSSNLSERDATLRQAQTRAAQLEEKVRQLEADNQQMRSTLPDIETVKLAQVRQRRTSNMQQALQCRYTATSKYAGPNVQQALQLQYAAASKDAAH